MKSSDFVALGNVSLGLVSLIDDILLSVFVDNVFLFFLLFAHFDALHGLTLSLRATRGHKCEVIVDFNADFDSFNKIA